MAISTITNTGRSPLGNGKWLIWGLVTGPASYTSGGEPLTRTVCSATWGVSDILALSCSPAGDADFSEGAMVTFERTPSSSTNVGEFHAYDLVAAHTHDLLIKGGQAAATHTHDIKIIGGQGSAGTDAVTAPAATDILGKEEATDADILGADSATKGGVVAASTASAITMVGTDTLGKEAATDRTIAGADSATKGGVVEATSSARAAEVTSTTNLSAFTFFVFGIGGS